MTGSESAFADEANFNVSNSDALHAQNLADGQTEIGWQEGSTSDASVQVENEATGDPEESPKHICARYNDCMAKHKEQYKNILEAAHCKGVLDSLRQYYQGDHFHKMHADAILKCMEAPPGK